MYLPTRTSGLRCAGLIFFDKSKSQEMRHELNVMKKKLTCSERHDTSPQVSRVERNVDTRKRNASKSTVQLDVTAFGLLLFEGPCVALLDDVTKHFLDFLDGEGFSELLKGH